MPRRDEIPKLVGIAIAKSPKLLLRISWRYLRAKKQAQRAEVVFRRRLESAGLDPRMAEQLADRYVSTVSIRQLWKQLGIPSRVFEDNGNK